eukprot:15472784-Alexandrium_andersonii.AAC.1
MLAQARVHAPVARRSASGLRSIAHAAAFFRVLPGAGRISASSGGAARRPPSAVAPGIVA